MRCQFEGTCQLVKHVTDINRVQVNKIKADYCSTNSSKCARYMVGVAFGIERVPLDIFPGDYAKAREFLGKNQSASR